MAERGQRLQLPTLPPRLLQEHQNCGPWHLETLPSKSFMKPKKLRFPGPVNSRRWVFLREGLDDFRKGCARHQHPKDVSLPHVHHRLPQATPKKRQNGLPEGATRLSKLPQARKAFLEGVEDSMALHPLALYPHLEEALPPQLFLQVLEVLDPEKNLEETWAYCRDTRKLMKGPTELEEKCSSQVCLPKKMAVSHSGQWLCEEKPSEVNSLYQDSFLHDNVRRGVRDFCDWAKALGSSPLEEELILQQFDLDCHTRGGCAVLPARRAEKRSVLSQLQEAELCHKPDRERRLRRAQDKPFIDGRRSLREHGGCWNKPPSSGRANPHRPKRVKMRYGAWYLKTNLWKKQRADEPLVDPKISHKAQDANFEKHLREQVELLAGLHGTVAFKDFILSRGYRMPRFLEKIYAVEKGRSENIKTPKKLMPTAKHPGRR
ncbi:protein FAM47E [Alexandromys fortis]|uniref:protein FAM47E n=1 Tax=Alexandromys fortis TaxID=100897 RepID=UPI0021536E19|nr:protein FAM47E [Microtus fortis]